MSVDEQVSALTWTRVAGRWFFRGTLDGMPRLIGGASKAELLPLAKLMAQGRA